MKRLTTFAEVNQYLTRLYRNQHTEYKLDNMRALMNYLGNPQEKFKVVHVAGTSGKTSTAYYMAALLKAGGYKTGLTVSPHVDQINERAQINGELLSEPEFCAVLSEYLGLIGECPVRPSWFEAMIGFVYWYFAREQVDYAVIEVGLGGLKDGTNVISRADKICVITDIGLDHVRILGDNLTEIAAQKAGIIQSGNIVFAYDQGKEVNDVLRPVANDKQADLHLLSQAANKSAMPDYQFRNWHLAQQVYAYLIKQRGAAALSDKELIETRQVQVPGRMDVRQVKDKMIIMDGAHNDQKMTAFVESYKKLYSQKPTVLIALREGKEFESIASRIIKLTDKIIVTSFESNQDVPAKSMDPAILAAEFKKAGIEQVDLVADPGQALGKLLTDTNKVGIITGSFYLINQLRSKLSE